MAVPRADDDGRTLTTHDEDAGPATGTETTTGTESRTGPRSRGRVVLAAVLVAALVAAAVGLGAVLWERRGEADDVQAQRDRAMAQAEQFLLRIGTFGPDLLEGDQMPEFRDRVDDVLTPKASAEFEEQVVVAEQLVAQQDASRSAEVFGSGVTTIDEDSATVLVAGSFTNSVGEEQGVPFPVYLKLEMVRTDGEWLVDEFGPALEDEDQALPGGQPSQEPSAPADEQPSGGATP